MLSAVCILLVLTFLPLKNVNACMPTPIRDETPEIPLTTRPPPPPPCSSCPTPVQTIDVRCMQLTITPCDENNRLVYDCGDVCVISTQNEPTDAFIPRGSSSVDVICDTSGNFFIGTPSDQVKVVRCT
uniref:Uncharacterized protein n=1 Tax=Panagrolaimus davidi TaxID=227884 RepID=A0A914QKF6_9BILA